MTTGKSAHHWTYLVLALVIVILVSGTLSWKGLSRSQPVEIELVPAPEWQGQIYIDGDVSSPGFYPLKAGDSVNELIEAAGGDTTGDYPAQLRLYVSGKQEQPPQKVDINRAEAWLLKALPGIGDTRARAIIEYRQQHGPFKNTNELLNVEGIGTAVFEEIRHLITVAD